MLFFRRRTGYRQNRPAKYFLAAVFFGMLLGGTVAVIRLIDPYALFGSAASGALPGLAAFGFVAVLTWFFGRIFCANICPVGTLLGLLAVHARKKILINSEQCVSCGLCATGCPTGSIDFRSKTVNNETCIKCFKCLTVCRQNGIDYRSEPVAAVPFSPERRRLLTAAAAAAVLSVAVKGGIRLSRTIADKTKKVILPAGAGNPGEFASRCLNCNLCVAGCPMKIIKKASADYPAVHIDYAESFCDYDCHNCSAVCPSGAIKKNFSGRKAENTNRPSRCRRKHLHQMRHLRHEMPASDYLPKKRRLSANRRQRLHWLRRMPKCLSGKCHYRNSRRNTENFIRRK